ncbi:MAG: TonB family protein [Candidatus Brocadiales bacterium]|nr:TonB family protein [Candidatus Brocadiales bacterium]
MFKKNLIIAGLIALSLHAALIMLSPNVTSEPEVIFKKGESSLKMNLVPSVASTASIKSINNTQKNIQKVEEKKNYKPQPVKKPQIIDKEQIKVEEKVVQKIIKKVEQENQGMTYGAEYFKTQDEINTKQPQKNNTATQESKEIIADIKAKGVTKGAMLKNVFKPSYPSSCKRQGHEGTTILEVTILSKGKRGNIEIIQSAGCESLDKAAIKALKKAKYIPAKRLGIPFTTAKKIAFNFKLEDYQ